MQKFEKLKTKYDKGLNHLIWNLDTHQKREITHEKFNKIVQIAPEIKQTTVKPTSYRKSNINLALFEDNSKAGFNFTMLEKEKIIYTKRFAKNSNQCDVIIRNAYPIAKYHMLYLPFFHQNLPQYINQQEIVSRVMRAAVYFDATDLVIGYNSKGAASSINSLHFQILDLKEFEIDKNKLYFRQNDASNQTKIYANENFTLSFNRFVDTNNCTLLKSIANNIVDETCNNKCDREEIVYFFKYELVNNTNSSLKKAKNVKRLESIASEIFRLITILNEKNIPYNILFMKTEILVFPRRNQLLQPEISIGFCEWLGIFVFYDKTEYENFNSEKFVDNYTKIKLSNNSLEHILKGLKSNYEDSK